MAAALPAVNAAPCRRVAVERPWRSPYDRAMQEPGPVAVRRVEMPPAPALVAGPRGAVLLQPDGEVEELGLAAAARAALAVPPLVCHARNLARRLDVAPFRALDLLELYAFVRPARFLVPTPAGLADALALPRPEDHAGEALLLLQAARLLLAELAADEAQLPVLQRLSATLARAGWSWGPAVLAATGAAEGAGGPLGGLDVWQRLPEWEEAPPEPPPSDHAVRPEEAVERLTLLLGGVAERRPAQAEFAAAAAAAFRARERAGVPSLVLAQAGTGIGKTLGYIAPASLWAERNGGPVWLSTYTKNLQRQLDAELDRLYPRPQVKRRKAVVRKGRENYLCLLNLEEAARASVAAGRPLDLLALGLMARWALATRDGDLTGDFPAWLVGLVGSGRTLGLADHRGECIYSACPHYRKCFIEHTVRRARQADLVIANHALVMIQAVLQGDDGSPPRRLVFDEGHHVFEAADGAFSAHLSGVEGADLRRWLLGNEGGRRSGRAQGLEQRIGDLVAGQPEAEVAVQEVQRAARALPGEGWLGRLEQEQAVGPSERFLLQCRLQVLARAAENDGRYSLECGLEEPVAGLLPAAAALAEALDRLERPMQELERRLALRLDEEAGTLESAARVRIEAACRSLARRTLAVAAWRSMLGALDGPAAEGFVDWLALDRLEGRMTDVGMHRHWIDPTVPFAQYVLKPAHGVLIASATLKDRPPEVPDDWTAAEVRTGALHLPVAARRADLASPFDYATQTRVLVVTDVGRNAGERVAAAYRELFLAAGGGALGLFTAIQRLRAVYRHIAGPLDDAGIALLAQHVDAMDVGTLVDIFRAETDACLLGTDAVRDGVDVPGRSLRLIVFDRVPWPRPDILHRARRGRLGHGRGYDDMLARLRLKQAYGRLVRRADDRGVFVMLDPAMPSRLATAFPPGVEPERVGLADAVRAVSGFLGRRPATDSP